MSDTLLLLPFHILKTVCCVCVKFQRSQQVPEVLQGKPQQSLLITQRKDREQCKEHETVLIFNYNVVLHREAIPASNYPSVLCHKSSSSFGKKSNSLSLFTVQRVVMIFNNIYTSAFKGVHESL